MTAAVTNIFAGGIPTKNAKSFSYDVRDYIQPDPVGFSIPAASASLAAWGNGTTALTAFTQKQLRSLSVVATVGSAAAAGGDYWTGTLTTLYAQNFNGGGNPVVSGTFSAIAGFNPSQVVGVGGTLTATGSNILTFTGTGVGLGNAFPAIGTNLPINNPYVAVLDGGTCTVICRGPGGTWTNTQYVFPSGPNGGLSMNPGDVFQLAKGTDTSAVYVGEAEFTFTPGTTFTI